MVDDSVAPSVRRSILSMVEDSRGNFLVGTSGGVYSFDRRTGKDRPFVLTGDNGPVIEYAQVLHEDRRKRLWIGTRFGGLYELNPATGRMRVFRNDPRVAGTLPENDIRGIQEDAAGQLWIATYTSGLARLDPRTGRIERFQHDPGDPRSISTNRIAAILADRSGKALWVGTEDAGLDFFDVSSGKVSHNSSHRNNPWGLNANSVWSLFQDCNGALWVGTFSGGSIFRDGTAGLSIITVPSLVMQRASPRTR